MTQIRHRLLEQMLSQQLITRAEIRYAPTRPAKVAGGLLLPSPKVIGYSGTAGTINLEPCDGQAGWCWELTITIEGTRVGPLYVLVPATGDVVELEDLVQVDPRTLTPTGGDLAAWQILLADVRAEVAGLPNGARKIDTTTMSFTRGGVDVFTPITLPAGPQGAASTVPGPAGTITSMSATGLAPGAAPTVTLGGTASARTIALGIPAGATGPGGTITSVTVSPLAPGAEPTITLGGTATARTIALGIPRGEKGDPGDVTGATWAGLPDKPTTFPPAAHGHALTDANITGVLPIAQIPTGSTGSTVALGNHVHTSGIAGTAITSGTVAAARLPASSATASGIVELADAAETAAGTDALRAVTPATLKGVLDARVGILDPIAVFLGDSHTTPTGTTYHWPEQLATAMGGWTVKNYAVAGMGYTAGPTTYAVQLTNALAALTPLEKLRVRHIFVSSCGNDATAAATTSAFVTAATSLFADLKTNFPFAQIHCIPAFYGSNGTNLGTARRGHLSRLVNALRDVALSAGVAFVDGSWTWTWGRADLMDSGDIHYTPAGKTWLARWVEQYLRGGTTWRDIPRTPLTAYGNAYGGYTGGGWQPLAWWMNRGVIYVNGGFTKAAAWTANAIANLPEEARPVENAQGIGCEVTWTGDIVNKQTGTGAGTLAASWPMF